MGVVSYGIETIRFDFCHRFYQLSTQTIKASKVKWKYNHHFSFN